MLWPRGFIRWVPTHVDVFRGCVTVGAVCAMPCAALSTSSSSDSRDVPQTTSGTLSFPFLEQTESAEPCSNLCSSRTKPFFICSFISCLWTCSDGLGDEDGLRHVSLHRAAVICGAPLGQPLLLGAGCPNAKPAGG